MEFRVQLFAFRVSFHLIYDDLSMGVLSRVYLFD
jgi:hypothetical protein